ncbi:MAG: hypothetical protein RXN86_03210 [Vulcanisaeta sp.]
MPADPWYKRVDVTALGEEARRPILERVKGKLGFEKTLRALGIARGSLHNYLHGVRTVPDNVVYRALQYLEESEFSEIVQGVDRLHVRVWRSLVNYRDPGLEAELRRPSRPWIVDYLAETLGFA